MNENSLISKKNLILFSFLYPAAIIVICVSFTDRYTFFSIDDAINESLGYYTQYGRIWAQGRIPFIVDTILYGGNGLVELSHAPFNPQVIIGSLIAWFFEKKEIVGIFIAWSNLFIISVSAILFCQLLKFKKKLYLYLYRLYSDRTFYAFLSPGSRMESSD